MRKMLPGVETKCKELDDALIAGRRPNAKSWMML
jgi:hypothetical protein